jgi:hypothetical protein
MASISLYNPETAMVEKDTVRNLKRDTEKRASLEFYFPIRSGWDYTT